MTQTPAEDILKQMGYDPEETLKKDKESRNKVIDRKVCICGHGMSRHMEVEGRGFWTCNPSKLYCPCEQPVAVLEVSDTRPFLRTTRGYGIDHALIRGLSSLFEKGGTGGWIGEFPYCAICKTKEGPIHPVAVNMDGTRILEEPGKKNTLLCGSCLAEKL